MNKKKQTIIGLTAAIVMLACACPASGLIPGGDTGSPTPGLPYVPVTEAPPVDTPQPPANIIFSDDFSSDTGEWETYSSDGEGSAEISNGAYVIRGFVDLWNWGRTDTEFADTVAEFDATLVSGPANDNAGLGFYCRLRLREDTSIDAYMLAISADGYYAILEFISGSPVALVEWTYSDAIVQGASTNRIRATCDGDQLILEVNGEEIASAVISAGGAASGYLSLAATSFESAEPFVEAHFDNFVVSEP